MSSPTSSHSNKLIYGRLTDARRPEPHTVYMDSSKRNNHKIQQTTGKIATISAYEMHK